MKKKVLLICNSDGALAVFRGPLIKALCAQGHTVVAVVPKGSYQDHITALGAKIVFVDFDRHSTGVLQNFKLFLHLLKVIITERPDIVHSFTHKAVIFGCFAARILRVPIIVGTVTGLGTLFIRNSFWNLFLRKLILAQYRFLIPKRAKIIFQNDDDKNLLEMLKAVNSSQSILTTGSGIDLNEYKRPSRTEVAKHRKTLDLELNENSVGKLIVLFVARGVPEKGFFEFYEAARELSKSSPDRFIFCHLGLVDLEASKGLGLNDIVEFSKKSNVYYLGHKLDPMPYLKAADIFSLPSYREGSPRSLIEGLALGKAIVASDVPGCKETVVQGQNGYLCQVKNSGSLAKAIQKIDDSLLENAFKFSRVLCEEKFDVEHLLSKTFQIYNIKNKNF